MKTRTERQKHAQKDKTHTERRKHAQKHTENKYQAVETGFYKNAVLTSLTAGINNGGRS